MHQGIGGGDKKRHRGFQTYRPSRVVISITCFVFGIKIQPHRTCDLHNYPATAVGYPPLEPFIIYVELYKLITQQSAVLLRFLQLRRQGTASALLRTRVCSCQCWLKQPLMMAKMASTSGGFHFARLPKKGPRNRPGYCYFLVALTESTPVAPSVYSSSRMAV